MYFLFYILHSYYIYICKYKKYETYLLNYDLNG